MDLLLAFAAGVAVALLVRRWRGSRAVDIALGDSQESPAARLQSLVAPLASVGDASAHPRDLLNNATFGEAVKILKSDAPIALVTDYATGANYILSAAAFAALAERPDRHDVKAQLERHFRHAFPWPVYYALKYFESLDERPPIGALVLHLPEYWAEHALVPSMFAEHFAARASRGDVAGFGESLSETTAAELTAAEVLLRKIDHPSVQALIAELAAWRRRTLDRSFLQSVGRFVEKGPEMELLVEHGGLTEQLATAEGCVLQEPPRSVLVVGEPGAGKTSFLMLLAMRAVARGWTVFEAGAANLMAGQQYFGQLEERLQRLTTELSAEKHVLWYVPDFLQLAASGTHGGQTASLLDQLFPAIAAGRVIVLSETTAASLTKMLQLRPGLRSAIDIVRLRPLNDAEINGLASDVAGRVSTVTGISIEPDVLDTAMHLARHYLGPAHMPGAALDLIKLTAQRVDAHDGVRMRREDVLATLSQLTGMPQLVLDDRERVDLAALRKFFSSRVIGQDEAVEVVVDRIAMLKAGLTDPTKPIAVFLFAGPTGTGKTELAKTLAAFLFGSAERLIRLDMSEFQAVESTRKILGDPDPQVEAQALTYRVRKQPFSVVLLDEFEKAHANAWDLFLQVFDDGRLTDAVGHTVDFRHCIIILTSNLGSTVQQGSGPGFVSSGARFSQEHVMRAVLQHFRPEFVNRLDAIIVFRPLTRELMRGILAKELVQVLERRGLRHREWAVEWESSAIEFLLDKGFSPAMGARPLKRAIDRHLLAPLAATLVEHRFPEGDQFLFVRSDGRAIQVEFVDPDAPANATPPLDTEPAVRPGLTLARMMLQPGGTAEERSALLAALHRIEGKLTDASWTGIEADLVNRMQQRDFWDRADRFRTLSRYALIDRVKAAIETARGLEARLSGPADRRSRYSRDLVARLASQLYVIQHGIDDLLADVPVEVILAVQPVLDSAREESTSASWCNRLVDMYRRWASSRRMQWEEFPGASPASPAVIVISGFGAARVLEREAGLHVLEYENSNDESARAVARVKVVPTPDALPDAAAEKRAVLLAEVTRAAVSASVIRRYRLGSSSLIRDVSHGWRTGRPELVLEGHFDLLADVLSN